MKISDEKINELLAGCDDTGNTDHWVFDADNVGKSFNWCWQLRTEYGGTPIYIETQNQWRNPRNETNERLAQHIARCDPDTIRALCNEVLRLRSEASS